MENKKILYIDLDGVCADFSKAIKDLCPEFDDQTLFPCDESRSSKVDEICRENPRIFLNLEPIDGCLHYVPLLMEMFNVYFLSVPMWILPESFTDKRIWVEKHFGENSFQRLILTHRKDLNDGEFLIDDRLKHGVDKFKGEHIHFGKDPFYNWQHVFEYLRNKR